MGIFIFKGWSFYLDPLPRWKHLVGAELFKLQLEPTTEWIVPYDYIMPKNKQTWFIINMQAPESPMMHDYKHARWSHQEGIH